MQGALKMHPASGNDLKTFLFHRTAFLCVSRFLRLASFGTVNALMTVISVTFQPLSSVIPKILCKFAIVLVRLPYSGTAIKRESGEKPGQSRCCKLQKSFRHQLIATVSGRNGKEVLKWSKSEDLPMPDNRRNFTLPGFSV